MQNDQPTRPSARPLQTKGSARTTFLRALFLSFLCLLLAGPAWGYIVFLKDGTQITTKEKYTIQGDKALLILPSGTQTQLDLAEIDIAKTDEINKVNLGNVRVVEGGQTRLMEVDESFDDEADQSLGKLINSRSMGLSLPENKARTTVNEAGQTETLPTTKAGFVDLMKFTKTDYTDTEISTDILAYLQGQGVDEARIYRGTAPDRVLVEAVAVSEASVFKVVKDAADAFLQTHGRFPDKVAALELILVTERQVRSGQFVLTPDLANQLATGAIDPATFFYRHVQF